MSSRANAVMHTDCVYIVCVCGQSVRRKLRDIVTVSDGRFSNRRNERSCAIAPNTAMTKGVLYYTARIILYIYTQLVLNGGKQNKRKETRRFHLSLLRRRKHDNNMYARHNDDGRNVAFEK